MSYWELKLSRDGNTQSEIKEINQFGFHDFYTGKSKSPKNLLWGDVYTVDETRIIILS